MLRIVNSSRPMLRDCHQRMGYSAWPAALASWALQGLRFAERLLRLCRWVYRNPYSILDPKAVDLGRGSKNGSVNSIFSSVPQSYRPKLRYSHMATLSHLPNGSIAAQWQVWPPLSSSLQLLFFLSP